ncbi:MAG: dihydrodipicolinate synthase family protein [SAR324 cluster bacterium]|nr:dihydrodipicolinate synthase family protein [SAR324 cluster bacterium]
MRKLEGIIAPATTAFDAQGKIDLNACAEQFKWLEEAGCHGLAVGGSTGEGHTLDRKEFSQLLTSALKEVGSELPIIAGIIVNSTQEAIERGKLAKSIGADALQVTPVHYLFRPDDESMISHFRELAEKTEIPIIIYNVVPWTYLSPNLLCRILREVPNVIGVKQSAGDMKLLADLLEQSQSEDLIFTAVDALLYPSFQLGAKGAIAALLAACPHHCVKLWTASKNGKNEQALELHRQLLQVWNSTEHDLLPACVKFIQKLQGCPNSYPRRPMPYPSDLMQNSIKTALKNAGIEFNSR